MKEDTPEENLKKNTIEKIEEKKEMQKMKILKKMQKKHKKIIVGILFPILVILLGFLVILYDPSNAKERTVYLPCVINEITGLECPGCGGTRAIYELLHFRFLKALSNNIFTILFIVPVTGYALAREYLNYLFEREVLPVPRSKNWMIVLLIILFAIFTILRNIPISPFNWLAPD